MCTSAYITECLYILYRMLHLRCGDIPLIYISWILMDAKGDNRHLKFLAGILQCLRLKLFPTKLTKSVCYQHENQFDVFIEDEIVDQDRFEFWTHIFVTDQPCLIPVLTLMVYFLYESPMDLLDGWGVAGVYKSLASLAEQTNMSVLSATDPFMPDWRHLPPRTPCNSWSPGKTNSGWYPPHAQRIRLWPHRSLLMGPIDHTKSLPQYLLAFASY